jgi:2-oxoglutarate dehydrogenase E1 component
MMLEFMEAPNISYLSFISPEYLETLRALYYQNPEALPVTWRLFFDGMELGEEAATATPHHTNGYTNGHGATAAATGVDIELRILNLIEAYRSRGHLAAHLNPLVPEKPNLPDHLKLSKFGLEGVSKEQKFQAGKIIGLQPATIAEIEIRLRDIYCRDIGVEYKHISDEKVTTWLEEKMEPIANRTPFSVEEKKVVLEDLIHATLFESFLQKSFTGQKRFSLEGAESTIPALKRLVRTSAHYGVKEIILGMAHRGRLNVLVNVLKKDPETIFNEFNGSPYASDFGGSGDVKYHLGYSNDVDVEGHPVHFSLCFNPSHLEAVDPVVEGVVRAKQDHNYKQRDEVLPILIHGDAAVIGQGIVTETMNLAGLEGYSTNGTVHVVINNQIGFTTLPEDSRSTIYCTDFAKAINAPVFHVNGDNAESVMHVVSLAAEFRQKFKRDVFVDIYCYRKYGHNEGDEPRFTQPQMYDKIGKQKTTMDQYATQCIVGNFLTPDFVNERKRVYETYLEEKLKKVKESAKEQKYDTMSKKWSKLRTPSADEMTDFCDTSIAAQHLDKVVEVIHTIPKDFEPLPKFRKMLETRLEEQKKQATFDWAVGEQIAFGSLLLEGYSVRLSGQDSRRGTFSHRHVEMTDHKTNKKYLPLQTLETDKSKFFVFNSPLSEYAVMGFEYGYSLAEPNSLTMWEAQFGDFANGAQIVVDQFISSSEHKWRRMSGLVLLLPHGYEGQGPEHSSARLERFLQMAGEENMQICYPTTPAQFCHMLRRQILRPFRKPLVVMTPKSPLRMPEVVSKKEEFTKGGFKTLLIDDVTPANAAQVILCTGKVYWDIKKAVVERKLTEKTVIVRLEQIYPLDTKTLLALKDKYKSAKDWVWVQEEPRNMGAWSFVKLATDEFDLRLRYAGRKTAASPATGSSSRHKKEFDAFIAETFRS